MALLTPQVVVKAGVQVLVVVVILKLKIAKPISKYRLKLLLEKCMYLKRLLYLSLHIRWQSKLLKSSSN